MATSLPTYIRVDRRLLRRRDALLVAAARALRQARVDTAFAGQLFGFKADEELFARQLLALRSQVWLYRVNQRAAAGDFIAVDMSSPWPERRPTFVLELKQHAPLRVGGGGVGLQLQQAVPAVRQLARHEGVVGPEVEVELLSGDRQALLAWLGAEVRVSAARPLGAA